MPEINSKQKKFRMENFSFIDAGKSYGRGSGTVSKNHDKEFVKSIYDRFHPKKADK